MADDFDAATVQIASRLDAVASDLDLKGENEPTFLRVLERAQTSARVTPPASKTRRTWTVILGLALLIVGGVEATAVVSRHIASADFKRLHPKKDAVNRVYDEPHVLVGKVLLPDGEQRALYATTAPGSDSCADVVRINKDGIENASVGFCSRIDGLWLDQVVGVCVGRVPGDVISSVKIAGFTKPLTVSYHYFLVPPELTLTDAKVTITGYDSDGNRLGLWRVTPHPEPKS